VLLEKVASAWLPASQNLEKSMQMMKRWRAEGGRLRARSF